MKKSTGQDTIFAGISLALVAVIIWSGNFIVARNIFREIPPVSLNFYRWLVATVILFPFALKKLSADIKHIRGNILYLLFTALTGVSLFNSFVYVGAHYTSAINLALIGTTSAPVIAVLLARIFLREQVGLLKAMGMLLCIIGVLYLLVKGNINNLYRLEFGRGDLWMLAAAFSFAVYNTLVKKKPSNISAVGFLFIIFFFGTVLLLPFFIYEINSQTNAEWTREVILSILYLAIGASVISFLIWNRAILIWNRAIRILGAGRTALFGNLIPVFSSLEAVVLLNETITWVHIVSFALVVTGLVLANLRN
jgi:drug/metabolite transporter (DMT)-like permease